METTAKPVLLLGAGNMGGALIAGWRRAEALSPAELAIRDPHPGHAALAARDWGASLNGPDSDLARAATVVLAVKPQIWRETAAAASPLLAPDAVIVSIVAGVTARDLAAGFAGRSIARVMPTTAAAIRRGAASLWAADATARARARALFAPLGAVVDLADEALLHAATAASGSAPAYFYALVEALEWAALSAGLPLSAARALARSTLCGAAALLEATGEDAATLRRQVTSPGGTTEAALAVLLSEHGLTELMTRAVAAAAARSAALGAS